MTLSHSQLIKRQRELSKESKRRTHYPRLYGITKDEFIWLCLEREFKCDICNKVDNLVPDHNHRNLTPHYRGLICQDCNIAIGFIRDNPDVAEGIADYLRNGNKHDRTRIPELVYERATAPRPRVPAPSRPIRQASVSATNLLSDPSR